MATLSITYNGVTTNLPEPSAVTVSYQDIDASTSGRNENGYMMRDVLRQNVAKVACVWNAASQATAQAVINACSHPSFSLTYLDPRTGTSKTITAYAGDKTLPVYWFPESTASTWMFEQLTVNFIEY